MKEIKNCINELRKLLKTREDELSRSENFNAYTAGRIDVIRKHIDSLESYLKNIEKNPAHRSEALKNFKAEANRIKKEIEANLSGGPSRSDI